MTETIEQKTFRYLRRCVDEYVVDLKSKKIIGDLHIYELASMIALAIAEAREACRWQPIETAPKDGTVILVMVPGSDIEKVVSWCDEPKNNELLDGKGVGWRMVWDSYIFEGIDYPVMWHPLPAAPKDEVTNE